jgi:hypothetical protein
VLVGSKWLRTLNKENIMSFKTRERGIVLAEIGKIATTKAELNKLMLAGTVDA